MARKPSKQASESEWTDPDVKIDLRTPAERRAALRTVMVEREVRRPEVGKKLLEDAGVAVASIPADLATGTLPALSPEQIVTIAGKIALDDVALDVLLDAAGTGPVAATTTTTTEESTVKLTPEQIAAMTPEAAKAAYLASLGTQPTTTAVTEPAVQESAALKSERARREDAERKLAEATAQLAQRNKGLIADRLITEAKVPDAYVPAAHRYLMEAANETEMAERMREFGVLHMGESGAGVTAHARESFNRTRAVEPYKPNALAS